MTVMLIRAKFIGGPSRAVWDAAGTLKIAGNQQRSGAISDSTAQDKASRLVAHRSALLLNSTGDPIVRRL